MKTKCSRTIFFSCEFDLDFCRWHNVKIHLYNFGVRDHPQMIYIYVHFSNICCDPQNYSIIIFVEKKKKQTKNFPQLKIWWLYVVRIHMTIFNVNIEFKLIFKHELNLHHFHYFILLFFFFFFEIWAIFDKLKSIYQFFFSKAKLNIRNIVTQ